MHHAPSASTRSAYFGRSDYDTGDESRNVFWLAIPTWGEAWHNNHHDSPPPIATAQALAARSSAGIIRLLEMSGPGLGRGPGRPARRDRRLGAAPA